MLQVSNETHLRTKPITPLPALNEFLFKEQQGGVRLVLRITMTVFFDAFIVPYFSKRSVQGHQRTSKEISFRKFLSCTRRFVVYYQLVNEINLTKPLLETYKHSRMPLVHHPRFDTYK